MQDPENFSKDVEHYEESEPYLGPGWAVVMLILYGIKEVFPAEEFSIWWWFQIYVLGLVVLITGFVIYKRYKFFQAEKHRETDSKEAVPDPES